MARPDQSGEYSIVALIVHRSLIPSTQPIQAFKSPEFKKMVNIASRATRSVTLPSPKVMRARIIHTFKQQMFMLKKRLMVRVHTFHPSSH
jgi:hypothetical protein